MNSTTVADQFELIGTPSIGQPDTFMARTLYDIPIHISEFVPERNFQDQWFPPADGRFEGYGPEDEAWMRPLGLGTVKKIDMGPVMFAIKTRLDDFVYNAIFNPPYSPLLMGGF